MDALELALRCSSLLMRTMARDAREAGDTLSVSLLADEPSDGGDDDAQLMSLRQQLNDSDCERHFNGQCTVLLLLVWWRGLVVRTSVFARRTFTVLRLTCSDG